jgi:hypothetical protein
VAPWNLSARHAASAICLYEGHTENREAMRQIACGFSIVLLLLIPLQATGQEKQNYVSIKAGTYTFTGGLGEANFATGFDGEIVYGRYLTPNFALELGTGYFHDGVNNHGLPGDIQGIPVMLTAKVIYPFHRIEVFAGAGYAVYFTKYKGFLVNADLPGHIAENDNPPVIKTTVFGGHFLAGVNYCFKPDFFFGIEAKYIITDAANFKVFSPTLNGYTITGTFGYRF